MRRLTFAAWAVFLGDAALVLLIAALGLAARESVERDTMFGLAGLGAVPLAALFAVLGPSTLHRKPVGLWICLVLGAVPLILVAVMVAQQNFL